MITLLSKPNKDYASISDCQLLSQINTDIKIINEAQASRQDKIIPILIHPDQTDVIKGKQLLLINKSHILILSSRSTMLLDKDVFSLLRSLHFS